MAGTPLHRLLIPGLCLLLAVPISGSAQNEERLNPFARPALDVAPIARLAAGQSDLVLRGVMAAGAASLANINGELLGIGDTINGHELVAIIDGRARLTKGDRTFELTLDKDNP